MLKLVIFDFDGTLVDTIQDVAICFNEALRFYGFPEWTLDDMCTLIGGDLETIVSKLLPKNEVSRTNIDNVKAKYRELYLAYDKPNSLPYPGIMDMLNELKQKNIKIAVNSNKGQMLLDNMVSKIFGHAFFDCVVGYSEERPSKPDPFGVELILKETNIEREMAIYVGDGASDIKTAYNSGIPCCFVTWGQGNDVRKESKFEVNTVEELENCLLNGI